MKSTANVPRSNVPRSTYQRSNVQRTNVQRNWPDSHEFWRDKRVTVTGGAGFLGSFVVEKLRARGATDICVPRKRDYDLVYREAVLDLLHDARPDPIIHLVGSALNRESINRVWRIP